MKSGNGESSGRKRKKPEPGSGFLRFLALLFSWLESLLGHADEVWQRREQRKKAQEAGTLFRLLALSCAALFVAGKSSWTCG